MRHLRLVPYYIYGLFAPFRGLEPFIILILLTLLSPFWSCGQDTTNVTPADIQRLRTDTYKIFEMYEARLLLCQQSQDAIAIVTKLAIDQNLKDLDRIRSSVFASDITIDRLTAIRSDLLKEIASLQKNLRKIRRRTWLERGISSTTIIVLSYIIIKNNLPP